MERFVTQVLESTTPIRQVSFLFLWFLWHNSQALWEIFFCCIFVLFNYGIETYLFGLHIQLVLLHLSQCNPQLCLGTYLNIVNMNVLIWNFVNVTVLIHYTLMVWSQCIHNSDSLFYSSDQSFQVNFLWLADFVVGRLFVKSHHLWFVMPAKLVVMALFNY